MYIHNYKKIHGNAGKLHPPSKIRLTFEIHGCFIASLFALHSNAIQRGEAALKKQALWYRDRKFATALKLIFFVGHAKQLPAFLRTREGLIFLRRNKIRRHFFLTVFDLL